MIVLLVDNKATAVNYSQINIIIHHVQKMDNQRSLFLRQPALFPCFLSSNRFSDSYNVRVL